MLSQTPWMRTKGSEVLEEPPKSLGSSVNARHPLQGGQLLGAGRGMCVVNAGKPCFADLGLSPHLTALMADERNPGEQQQHWGHWLQLLCGTQSSVSPAAFPGSR